MNNPKIFSFLLLAQCALALGNPFATLEKIAGRAKNFDEFLSHPEWVNEYREALVAVYGKQRFNCESFESILTRAKLLSSKVEGFGERIWETTQAKPASISLAAIDGKTDKY